MRRVDLEVDRLPVDALVVSCYPGGFILDFALNLGEVVEPPAGNVKELSPFILAGYACWGMWDMNFVVFVSVFVLAWEIDELQDKRAASYDAAASRQEISANDVLKYRRLSGGLRSYNDLVWSVWVLMDWCRAFWCLLCAGSFALTGGACVQSEASRGNHFRWC